MTLLEVLRFFSRGGATVSEMAEGMGMDRSALLDRIHALERMGYLKRMEKQTACRMGSCLGCPAGRSCGEHVSAQLVAYELTGKGRRALRDGELVRQSAQSI